MPRTCTVCVHPERAAIDTARVDGASNRRIATRFSLTEAAVRRHAHAHLPASLALAHDAAEVARGDDLLAEVRALRARAAGLLDKAEKMGDYRTALAGIREARGCLELLAKLLGQLDERPQVNLTISAEWLQVRTILLDALRPHPEARAAVAARLVLLEGARGAESAERTGLRPAPRGGRAHAG